MPGILVIPGAAVAVHTYSADMIPPVLSSFALNFHTDVLTLTFNKALQFPTFQVSHVTFQSTSTSAAHSVTLSGGMTSQVSPQVIAIRLSHADLLRIQSDPALAVTAGTTFISLAAASVLDLASNQALSIPSSAALGLSAAAYTADDVLPVLTSFNLDMNSGTVTFSFSEIVNTATLILSQFFVQKSATSNAVSNTLGTGAIIPSLDTNGSVYTLHDVVTVRLTLDSANAIRAKLDLAKSNTSTYLSMQQNFMTINGVTTVTATAIQDMAGNYVQLLPASNAQIVTVYTPDTTPSTLASFDINMSSGTATLHYDKPVQVSTFDVRTLTFGNSASPSAIVYTLTTSSHVGAGVSTDVLVTVGAADLN